jgi:hypothetical protein
MFMPHPRRRRPQGGSQQRMVKRLDVAVGLMQLGEYLPNALKLA